MVRAWPTTLRSLPDRQFWFEPPSVSSVRACGRVTGALYIAGGGLVLPMILFSSELAGMRLVGPIAICLSAIAFGAITLAASSVLPRWFYQLTATGSTALITAMVALLGDEIASRNVALLYFFVVADVAFFFSVVGMLAQLLLIFVGGSMAMGYAGVDGGTLLLIFGSITVNGIVVAWLARLADRADEDPLTELTNRRALSRNLEDSVDDAARTGRALALVVLDLDYFKSINDTQGHAAGDEILITCARRWSKLVPDLRMLSRLGGDEFALVLPGHTLGRATEVAEAMRLAVQPEMTVSAGVAAWQPGDSPSTLMGRADVALYDAKSSGRNQIAVYGDPEHRARELEAAVANNEFVMHYQPVVRLSDRAVVSHEALVRWQHPTRGLLGPDEFVNSAERTGAIHALGAWTLSQACRKLVTSGTEGAIAVNVSMVELQNPSYFETVADTVALHQVDPSRLVIEVTEAVYDHLTDQVVVALRQLRALGVRIAIDDFGSGYSSLRWLEEFPLDIIKIDGAFVRRITDDTTEAPILQAIIAIGHALGAKVVAEQVETEHQAKLLREMGCQCAQGYLFGRPAPQLHEAVSSPRPDPSTLPAITVG